jgi:hypothetical protein
MTSSAGFSGSFTRSGSSLGSNTTHVVPAVERTAGRGRPHRLPDRSQNRQKSKAQIAAFDPSQRRITKIGRDYFLT